VKDLLLPIVTVLLGGGFIGGFVLLLKLRPEAGEITVRSAEKVVLIQDNLIDELRGLVKDAEARCSERIGIVQTEVDRLRREVKKRPTRGELLDENGKLRRQLLAEGITPNGPE
jgi:hypothetical protein